MILAALKETPDMAIEELGQSSFTADGVAGGKSAVRAVANNQALF